MKCKLSLFELSACFVWWMVANGYSLFKLYESQTNILEEIPDAVDELNDLQPGWSILDRLKDITDVEWSTWMYFMYISWPYFIGQFITTEIIRRTKKMYLPYWYFTSTAIFVLYHMGIKHFLLIIAQPLIYAAIIFSGGETLSIWSLSIFSLISHNRYKPFLWEFLDHDDLQDEEVYLLLFALPWIGLRCISFCSDYVENLKKEVPKKTSKEETLISLLSYSLYLPLLYNGPLILYEDFEKSLSEPVEKLSIRLKRFTNNLGIFLCYTIFLDLALHYVYFYAMQGDLELIRMFPTIALCGGCLWMGIQFYMKYNIAYGMASAYGRLDNIDTPPTPRCIARIHVYSHMWRYFDVGLYKFFIRYINRPSLEVIRTMFALPKLIDKMAASLITFLFATLWHGATKRIYLWSASNYLAVTLEYLSKEISETEQYKWFKKTVLRSDAMETRFIALICVPLFVLSIISNIYIMTGTNVGEVYIEYFMNPFIGWNSLLICLSLYCGCVTSIALKDIPSRTDAKRILKVVE